MCNVKKDRASPVASARVYVVIQDTNKIVKLIIAPHAFCTGRIRVLDGPVVVAVLRGVTPAIVSLQSQNWQRRGRSDATVWAKVHVKDLKNATWRRPIAFAFLCTLTTAPQHTGNTRMAEIQPTMVGSWIE